MVNASFASSSDLLACALEKPDQFVARTIGPDGTSSKFSMKELDGVSPRMVNLMRPPRTAPPRLKRRLVPHRTIRSGFQFRPSKRPSPYKMSLGKLQYFLKGLLGAKFDGDVKIMAKGTGLARGDLEKYLDGGLPNASDTAFDISKMLKINGALLTTAWMIDAMNAIDFVYPIPPSCPPLRREFIELVRLVSVRLGGLEPMHTTLADAGHANMGFYTQWNEVFNANTRRAHAPHGSNFRDEATELIEESGVASRAEVVLLFEEMVKARHRKRRGIVEVPVGGRASVIGRAMAWDPSQNAEADDPFDALVMGRLSALLQSFIGKLSPQQEGALRMRLGMGGYHDHTFEEIARELGCSKQNASQLKHGAIEFLKRSHNRLRLEPFFDLIRSRR